MNFRGKATLVAVIAACAATVPTSASADAVRAPAPSDACGTPVSRIWQAFLAFGDPADYWLAPAGDFESGARGWGLKRAYVMPGNDTTGVLKGRRSLALGFGLLGQAEAVSPSFCIDASHPTFRYTFKPTGLVGLLSTFVRYKAVDGTTQEQQVWSKTATTLLPGQWRPSDLQPLATRVPMKTTGGRASVQLVFRAPINLLGSGYQIDNVLVDPYRTR